MPRAGYRKMFMSDIAVLAVLALTALGGCGGAGVIDYVRLEPGYQPQQFGYAAGGRDLKVDVQGNPFAIPQDEFAALVTNAMQGAHFGQPTNFTSSPGDSARADYRVRLLFNGAGTGRIVCAGEPAMIDPSPNRGDVRLLAAFCHNQDPLSYLTAHVSGLQDAHDPAFRDFVRQVTSNLFPPQNYQERDRGCVPPGDC